MPVSIEGYVIITADGKLKKPRHTAPSFFTNRSTALTAARNAGDSVVPVTLNLDREPILIRSKVL